MVKRLKRFLEDACDQYCACLSDQEFNLLVDGLEIKIKEYLQDMIVEL